jgi:hypothetical protein
MNKTFRIGDKVLCCYGKYQGKTFTVQNAYSDKYGGQRVDAVLEGSIATLPYADASWFTLQTPISR